MLQNTKVFVEKRSDNYKIVLRLFIVKANEIY